MKKQLALLIPIWLTACGTASDASVTPKAEYGEGVVELRFDKAWSFPASAPTALAEKATQYCHGPYQKVGERMDGNMPIWLINCVETVQ